jgi:hypothetical protein
VESAGSGSTTRVRSLLAAVGVALVGISAAAAPAGAAVTHLFQSSFASTSPRSIAVDESTGSVYVIGESPGTLTKYDATGNPSNFSALGTNSIDLEGLNPRMVTVDNSGGVNDGVIYVSRGNEGNNVGVLVYLANGEFVTEFKKDSFSVSHGVGVSVGAPCAVAVSATGALYIVRSSDSFGSGSYIDKFVPGEWIPNSSPPQTWAIAGTMGGNEHQPGFDENEFCKLALDAANNIYIAQGSVTGSGATRRYASSVFSLNEPPFKTIDSGTSFAVDRSNDDLYSDRDDSIARFDSNGVLREVFAGGEFERSAGVAVNSTDSTAYVTVRRAGGVTANEVRIYQGAITPDITGVSAAGSQTSALLSAATGTAGAGDVTGCRIEYGTGPEYGSEADCEQTLPYTGPESVTVKLTGLSKETTYHYRFVVSNENGSNKDIDGTFTTHNVGDVTTDAPTEVTQTGATLNGSYNGSTTDTPTNYFYYFEWGDSPAYGNTTAGPPGVDNGVHSGTVQVSAPITGLSTYLPTSSPYHYRLVVTNDSGTTYGPDRAFFSAPPDLPQITETAATEVTTTGVTLSSTINPGNGDTVYTFEYGTDTSYGSFTPISESIGNDSTPHPVSSSLSGLEPGTTYHFRAVANNFGGTSRGEDQTFSTTALPSPPVEPPPANPIPATPPGNNTNPGGGGEVKCKKGFVKRKGKCVKKHRKHKRRHHHG